MKELLEYLGAAASGRNIATAINIPTAEIRQRLPKALMELGIILGWLTSYLEYLDWLSNKQKRKLTQAAKRDYNQIERFIKTFADAVDGKDAANAVIIQPNGQPSGQPGGAENA